jgi:uncharacterized protein YggT (Ycf19 family)
VDTVRLYGLAGVEAIFSWVNPHAPLAPFVRALNEPLLRPIRRVVPLVGNLDLSLLVALILLQIAQLLGMLFMAFSGRGCAAAQAGSARPQDCARRTACGRCYLSSGSRRRLRTGRRFRPP